MSASVWTHESDLRTIADKTLRLAAQLWFLVAVTGQFIFVAYVIAFYGGTAVRGNLEAWNEVLPRGYEAGATLNNVAVAAHLSLAVIVTVGGALQLMPQVRRLSPTFHRWNGRLFIVSAFVTSIAGLIMVWTHTSPARLVQHLGISLDALLIMSFAALALRSALARDFRTHRRWALRLFIVVNAVWFFRVMLMLWVFINRGAVGFDPQTFTGPFLDLLSFADYLLPLAVLEVYLRTEARGGTIGRLTVAAGVVVLTVAMGVGIFAATMVMWLPRM
ncbi:MAG TPA: DUF2306 domain-containing protein [Thermoanaerobaculia bacterium]|nr:DUF2306 domain-containing protein [Thermoanaerobaculia bacterium]